VDLFPDEIGCWQANLGCGPTPCAELDMLSCTDSELCKAIFAGAIVQDVDWCVVSPSYAGCALDLSCAAFISYACMIGEPDSAHQFNNSCLPEAGWEFCEPPEPEPPACD
jgi:hypothetical protein